MARNYVNTAPPIGLTVAALTTDTVLTVASTAGYPAATFLLGLERGTANEEVVLCTALTGTTFTVTRAYDGTTALTHAIGTSVEHTIAAIDYRELYNHVASVSAHGVAIVAGVNEAQTFTGKTIDGGSNTLVNIPSTALLPLDASKITTGVFASGRIPQIAYSSLSGIPTTFTPAAHTHVPADIIGPIDATTIGGRHIFVQSTAPSGTNGDIWFQV